MHALRAPLTAVFIPFLYWLSVWRFHLSL